MAVLTKAQLEARMRATYVSGGNITAKQVRGYQTDLIDTLFDGIGGASGVVEVEEVNITGALFSRPEFVGLTISDIKESFRLMLDGNDLITRDGTTLDSDGVIDFGFGYTGTAYFVQLKAI